jgi:hypothetical protein
MPTLKPKTKEPYELTTSGATPSRARHEFNARITLQGCKVTLNCLEEGCPWCVSFATGNQKQGARKGRESIADHRQIRHLGAGRFPQRTVIDLVVVADAKSGD